MPMRDYIMYLASPGVEAATEPAAVSKQGMNPDRVLYVAT